VFTRTQTRIFNREHYNKSNRLTVRPSQSSLPSHLLTFLPSYLLTFLSSYLPSISHHRNVSLSDCLTVIRNGFPPQSRIVLAFVNPPDVLCAVRGFVKCSAQQELLERGPSNLSRAGMDDLPPGLRNAEGARIYRIPSLRLSTLRLTTSSAL
jgi:hypothetical protein